MKELIETIAEAEGVFKELSNLSFKQPIQALIFLYVSVPALIQCPDCGMLLESDGGCVICRSCGYSKYG